MHAHVCFFQRAGNTLTLLHQLLHILFCPRDLFKTLDPPISAIACNMQREVRNLGYFPLQTQEVHFELNIPGTHWGDWTEPPRGM